jgi:hypothetical protein
LLLNATAAEAEAITERRKKLKQKNTYNINNNIQQDQN